MSVNERVSTADDCNNVRVTFSDTVTNDDVGMVRGSVVPVHPSTESNRGNSVILVQRCMITVRDLVTAMYCWIHMLVNQCLKVRIYFILLNRHPHP
jgi:hypothetical protein